MEEFKNSMHSNIFLNIIIECLMLHLLNVITFFEILYELFKIYNFSHLHKYILHSDYMSDLHNESTCYLLFIPHSFINK